MSRMLEWVSVCGAWEAETASAVCEPVKPQVVVGVEHAKRGLRGAQFYLTVARQLMYTVLQRLAGLADSIHCAWLG